MIFTQNLHTHTSMCDGKHTPEEMVEAALAEGFTELGFSDHIHTVYTEIIDAHDTELYKAEIRRLKEVYRDRIDIFLGIEYDRYCHEDVSDFDYTIAGVHALQKNGMLHPFHRNIDVVERLIEEQFGGDGMAYAKCYYEAIAGLPEEGNFDIVGHFDAITRHVEMKPIFDMESKEYRDASLTALHALAGKIPFFEVNTGGVARKFRTAPYPSIALLKEMKQLGINLILSSDCHDKYSLTACFAECAEMIRSVGYREIYVLKKSGFTAVPLE